MRLACALLLAVALPAAAHQQSVSTSEWSADGNRVEARLRFATSDLTGLISLPQPLDDAQVSALSAPLARLTLDELDVEVPAGRCLREGVARAATDGPDGILVEGAWRCPTDVSALRVRVGFLEVLPPGHTHLAKIALGDGGISQRVAQLDDPWLEAERSTSFARSANRFLLLGIEHIFTGYDHIAFLLGLLLLGGTFRELVKVVTAFTAAHSITLALATLDVVRLPPRVVEPLIAASIVYVAIENLWALRSAAARAQAVRHRWVLTFAFGLVHGFGFAGVLAALHLPRSGIAAALVTFNVGVEIGQICIVAVALPLLARLRRARGFDPAGVRAVSACVGVLGLLWLVQRLLP
jgi:hydrogenase/urease accessory protein HupE